MTGCRPIGAEFNWVSYPYLSLTTDPATFMIIRYRVVAHSPKVDGTVAERVEPVDIKKFSSHEYRWWCGQLLPVPPADALPYLDAGWKALHREAIGEQAVLGAVNPSPANRNTAGGK